MARNTGQRIPCFDSCQLIIKWMSNNNSIIFQSTGLGVRTYASVRTVTVKFSNNPSSTSEIEPSSLWVPVPEISDF